MRLIDVNTLKLKEFISASSAPPYAILSHTWESDQEVTFQEWEQPRKQEQKRDSVVRHKTGFAKIIGACRRAKQDGLGFLWCDTNCIDKTSSAELSEAINSMFRWYRDSTVCYAYLADVKKGVEDLFAKSRWFTRGWTLQELLAPGTVMFFDGNWSALGDRKELAGMISDVTRIHIGVLKGRETIRDYSIAQRMSWAADRQTSREEDIAYCLLGIFDVNMPLLYGEGVEAFTRLQGEIIKVSADQSILAWDLQHTDTRPWTSALASSPAGFRFCGSIARSDKIQPTAYSITNLGISVSLALIKTLVGGVVFVGLNCARELCREAKHSKLPGGIQTPRTLATGPHEGRMESLGWGSCAAPSGVLFTIAAGKMTSHEPNLRQAYPLGDISILQLRCRCTSTVSHQLISSGETSIIFSVFWDRDGLPQEWLHTTFVDPKLKVSNQMASETEWDCLFDANGFTHSARCCRSTISMRSLHEKLKQMFGKPLKTYVEGEKNPIVIVENPPLQNSFGQPELIVHITFRETPRPASVEFIF
ncbi:hypothetical protein AAE478_005132 [Parahypoxylon ruwenzoriense]